MMKDQYCIIIWNNDKHSFNELMLLMCDWTIWAKDEVFDIAHRVDEFGGKIVDMNTNASS
jgi:E3 ubiquitin-protein ligase UBR1